MKDPDTSNLDGILKGEILTQLSGNVSPENVDAMAVKARRRFAPNALWTIVAVETEQIDIKARARLKAIFEEFRLSGGTLLVAVTDKPGIITAFRMAAIQANATLKPAKNRKEASELAIAHRAKRPKP